MTMKEYQRETRVWFRSTERSVEWREISFFKAKHLGSVLFFSKSRDHNSE